MSLATLKNQKPYISFNKNNKEDRLADQAHIKRHFDSLKLHTNEALNEWSESVKSARSSGFAAGRKGNSHLRNPHNKETHPNERKGWEEGRREGFSIKNKGVNESHIVSHDPTTYSFLVHKANEEPIKKFKYTDAEDKEDARTLANAHAKSLNTPQIKEFSEWLIESIELDNDGRGKLHELLTAAHVNRLIHGQLAHAEHFRDEKGRSPEEAHNALVDNISDNSYQEAHSHAAQAAEAIHNHIKTHHPELLANKNHQVKVSWTSLKSDHEKLTGKKDEAHSGGADIMVSSHDKDGECHHAVGYSLKIADNKITTGQSGSKTTEQVLGMKQGVLSKHDENHRKEVNDILKKHGHDADNMSEAQKHAAFKISRDHKTPAGRKMADDIRVASYKHAANKVKALKSHLSALSDNEQKSRISEFVAPSHTYPTYQVATSPKSHVTNIKNEKEEVDNKYNTAGKLSFLQSTGNGNSLLIKNNQGKTLHRIEVRAKRPVGHSEIMVK